MLLNAPLTLLLHLRMHLTCLPTQKLRMMLKPSENHRIFQVKHTSATIACLIPDLLFLSSPDGALPEVELRPGLRGQTLPLFAKQHQGGFPVEYQGRPCHARIMFARLLQTLTAICIQSFFFFPLSPPVVYHSKSLRPPAIMEMNSARP